MCVGILQKKMICGANVGERAGPASSIVTDAAVFEVGGCKSPGGESRAEMACVIEVVFGAPEASMNVGDQRIRRLYFS